MQKTDYQILLQQRLAKNETKVGAGSKKKAVQAKELMNFYPADKEKIVQTIALFAQNGRSIGRNQAVRILLRAAPLSKALLPYDDQIKKDMG